MECFRKCKTFNIDELDENTDYSNTTFYKERWINENGLEQRIIVTFSLKYLNFTRRKRADQIARAANRINNNPSRINSARSTDFKRFIEQTNCTSDGELATINSYSINEERIAYEQQYDGFYAVCTNLEDEARDIIKINHKRWEIEESFRIMKTEFKARPVFLKRDDRIKVHFLTCVLSLLIFRILEKKTEREWIYPRKYLCSNILLFQFSVLPPNSQPELILIILLSIAPLEYAANIIHFSITANLMAKNAD